MIFLALELPLLSISLATHTASGTHTQVLITTSSHVWCNFHESHRAKRHAACAMHKRKRSQYAIDGTVYGANIKKWACAALTICLLACSKSSEVGTASFEEMAVPVPVVSITRKLEFAFNAEQFVAAFNAAAKSSHQSFRIGTFDVKHGTVRDYFKQGFTDKTSLTVSVSKETGHIISVTAVVAGNPDAINRPAVLAISEVIAEATNPDLSRSKASALASDMMQESGSNHEAGKFPQRFINNVRYVLRSDSEIGYWWMASPA